MEFPLLKKVLFKKLWALYFVMALLPLSCLHAQGQNRDISDWAHQNLVPGKHRGEVTAVIHKGDVILSAGEDGFLEIWNVKSGTAVERFQLTQYGITAMAARPGKDEICIVESDRMGLYRVTAWNYRNRQKIFTLLFSDPIEYVTFSAGGNFIIASGAADNGLVFIDSQSGRLDRINRTFTGSVRLAATGKSEKTLLAYLSSGALSYWDLNSGLETGRFDAPPNLSSPILFANGRYLAGIARDALYVLDAASGTLLERNSSIRQGSFLCAEGDDFFCVSGSGGNAELYRFTIDRGGRLSSKGWVPLSINAVSISAVSANDGAGGSLALCTTDGTVMTVDRNGQIRSMASREQIRLTDIAVNQRTIGFLSDKERGFLPLDYSAITGGQTISTEKNDGYTRISPFINGESGGAAFLFWQTADTRTFPMIRSEDRSKAPEILTGMPFRAPLRAASTAGGKVLFLDSTGNISVVSPDDRGGKQLFSFSSIGSIDAVFLSSETILLGRSTVSRNSPFLRINIITGETVPLPYPAEAGAAVYSGDSGAVYAAVVTGDENGIKTSMVHLDIARLSQSTVLTSVPLEDTLFSMAEAAGNCAATIGGDGAALYAPGPVTPFERTSGLPLRLSGGRLFFISLDAEGSISWHDSRTGKLLAVFRLYQDEWTLQTPKGILRGPVYF